MWQRDGLALRSQFNNWIDCYAWWGSRFTS